jgi:hypothetical protein
MHNFVVILQNKNMNDMGKFCFWFAENLEVLLSEQ